MAGIWISDNRPVALSVRYWQTGDTNTGAQGKKKAGTGNLAIRLRATSRALGHVKRSVKNAVDDVTWQTGCVATTALALPERSGRPRPAAARHQTLTNGYWLFHFV